MKKYSVFDLFVINKDEVNFICLESLTPNQYIEFFTNEKINLEENMSIESLTEYYSLLAVKNYTTGQPLKLDKKSILLKYIEINQKHYNEKIDLEEVIESQEKYLEEFNKLKELDPQRAKEVALKSLRKTGILDEKDEPKEPYNKVFIKKRKS